MLALVPGGKSWPETRTAVATSVRGRVAGADSGPAQRLIAANLLAGRGREGGGVGANPQRVEEITPESARSRAGDHVTGRV